VNNIFTCRHFVCNKYIFRWEVNNLLKCIQNTREITRKVCMCRSHDFFALETVSSSPLRLIKSSLTLGRNLEWIQWKFPFEARILWAMKVIAILYGCLFGNKNVKMHFSNFIFFEENVKFWGIFIIFLC
jgi:hypothetical protein